MTQNRYYSSSAQPTTLSASVTATTTTVAVAATSGFPTSTPFTLTLDSGSSNEEVVTVTGVSGLNLTVVRGEDGTPAVAHALGAVVQHAHSARDFAEPQVHLGSTAGVHGVTGTVVGTSDAQTLTNKDLTTGNTFPASLATASSVTSVNNSLATHTSATSGVHGTTGAVVGTTDTQTLTNKDLSSSSNIFPVGMTPARFAVSTSNFGTSSSTPATIPGCSLSVQAGKTYQFTALAVVTGNASFQIATPGGTFALVSSTPSGTSGQSGTASSYSWTMSSDGLVVQGTYVASTSGTFELRGSSNSGSLTTFKTGALLRLDSIA